MVIASPRFTRLGLGLLAGLIALVPAPGQTTNPRFTGTPFLRVWLPEDYGGTPGNRGVLQHPRNGFIYVANGSGMLEFDGTRWRLIRTSGGAPQTVAVDGRGRVWFAGDNQLGSLEPDAHGELHAVPALPRLPAGEPPVFPLGAAASAPNGVYFINRDRVFFFGDDGKPAKVWRPNDGDLFTGQLWWMGGELALRAGSGVRRLHNGEFQPVAGLKTFAFATRSDPAGGWQLAGRDGLRRWDGAYRPVAPGLTPLMSPLGDDYALHAVFLRDERIAWGTARSGVIVSDRVGRRLQVIGRDQGLPSNRVEGLCEDRQGGLWVTFRNGLARLQLDSPYARHGESDPVDATPHAIALHAGNLYVGGGEGLTRRDPSGLFHPVQDLSYLVRGVVTARDRLFVTGIELREVLAEDRTRLLGKQCYGLVPLRNTPDIMASGAPDGVHINRLGGDTLQSFAVCEKISGPTSVLLEWPAGIVWAANQTTGLWQIDLRGGERVPPTVKNFGPEHGLPPNLTQYNITLFPLGPGLNAIAQGKLLRFDPAVGRFLPEDRIDGLPVGSTPNAFAQAVCTGDADSVWLQLVGSGFNILQVRPTGAERWRAEHPPPLPLRAQRASALLHDPATSTLWIGQPGALISRDLDWRPPPVEAAPFEASVRLIETDAGTLLWADGKPPETLALPPAHNALRILYAAPRYPTDHLGRSRTLFRTRLDGLDHDWSRWTTEARRDFTNLPYHEFLFRVQALDESGRPSKEATFAFSLAPPWWLTRWAMGGYVVLGAGAMAGLFALRTRTLRRRNESLERTILTRTQELHAQNRELARLNQLELDEKISARLAEEKARLEVLRYQLNPHFLFNSLNSICGEIIREPLAARAMVIRLADFCRLTLHCDDHEETTTVAHELKMLRAYLEIEQARLGDLLAITINAEPDVEAVRLPPFLLLPLVENAVKYGTATSTDQVGVRLSVRREGDVTVIEVANTGQWLAPGSHSAPSHGIGLENLRQRLARYFPHAHEFTTSSADGWVVVRVRLTALLRESTHPNN